MAEEKKIAVTTDLPPRCEVLADTARLRQALANLLDNALKYTSEAGSVSIKVSCLEARAEMRFAIPVWASRATSRIRSGPGFIAATRAGHSVVLAWA